MKVFDIELVSPCNARCDFCPQKFRGVKRARPYMAESTIDRVTTEIGVLSRTELVGVVFCGMGENLLRKELVIRALDSLQSASQGAARTTLVTNGSTLTAELLESASFRKLDAIEVSFSGHDKESYEGLYRLKHEKVVANVLAMARAMPGKLTIQAVDLVRLRGHRGDFERFWNASGIPVRFSALHSRGGHIADPEAYQGSTRPFESCEIFDFVSFISSDGFVLSCCHDVGSENVIGDCSTATLAEIEEKKRDMRRDQFGGFRICERCTDFTGDGWRQKFPTE